MKAAFCNGTLSNESTCQTVALIPKWTSGDFREIGLIKVLWKAVTRIKNQRLKESIKLHDVLHGFWAGRGTGTSSLEAKLLQQLTDMR